MITLIFTLVLLVLFAEITVWIWLKKIRKLQIQHGLFVDLPKLKHIFSTRQKVLRKIYKHYTLFDASVGIRMKANTTPFRMAHKSRSSKRKKSKTVKLQNFFEIHTDSHGFISNSANQERDYASLANDPHTFKILAIGNSVTAGSGTSNSESSWPALLEKQINEKPDFLPKPFTKAVVINASILGSQISQEIRRFQDELVYLSPHLVISFSGGIMDYSYIGNPVDPTYHEKQKKANDFYNLSLARREKIFLPNICRYIRLIKGYPENDDDIYPFRKKGYCTISADQLLLSRITQFKGICDAYGIDFMFVLQPGMGVGKKEYTKSENALTKHFERYFFEKPWDEYQKVLSEYIAKVRKSLVKEYSYDFIDVFENIKETVFCDPRHQNNTGHQILANEIEKIVEKRIYSCIKKNQFKK